jgi:two-component system CheB/CheR fusion protein
VPVVRPLARLDATPGGGERVLLRESALDGTPVAQLVVGLDGALALASQAAREAFGLTSRDIGRPLQDLEISYRPVELRSVIERAYAERRGVVLQNTERPRPGETLYYDVHVAPLLDSGGALVGTQITFLDVTQAARLQHKLRRSNEEFEAALEELQSTGEELETTNEELQSTIEELETTNEELQATSEELETMNEELQSTNEELQTLNDELRRRGDDLQSANGFLETILATLRTPVIVIDRELRVKAWNSCAQEMWGLRSDEVVGKSLMGLDIGLPVEKLGPPIRTCFAGEEVAEIDLEAMNRRGRPVSCRVTCSRLAGTDEVRGAVLVIGTGDVATP